MSNELLIRIYIYGIITLIVLVFVVEFAIIIYFKLTKKNIVDILRIDNVIEIKKNQLAKVFTQIAKLIFLISALLTLFVIQINIGPLRTVLYILESIFSIFLFALLIIRFLKDKDFTIQISDNSLIINSQPYNIEQLKHLLIIDTTSSRGSVSYSLLLQFQVGEILLLNGVSIDDSKILTKELKLLLPSLNIVEKSKLFYM